MQNLIRKQHYEDSSFGKGHPVQKEMTHGEVKEMTALDPEH